VIPLRDINPTVRTPLVTYAFIALNLAVFVYEFLWLPPEMLPGFVSQHAVVPVHLFSGYVPSLSTPLTSMFMHGGLAHLAGNLWFLHVFGDNVEDVLGHVRYAVFYLVCGLVAVFAHAAIEPTSLVPMVGASGAISGVLGAYVLLHPRARVVTFVPIFFLFELPASMFIIVWFGLQVFAGFGSLGAIDQAGGGVAFFAHIGGFLAGILFVWVSGAARGRKRGARVVLGPRRPTRRRQ